MTSTVEFLDTITPPENKEDRGKDNGDKVLGTHPKRVAMSIDGWSNVVNHPVLGILLNTHLGLHALCCPSVLNTIIVQT